MVQAQTWQPPEYVVRFSVRADQLGQVIPWGLQLLGIPELHKQGIKGEGQLVAVLDTGVDRSHPDMKGAIDDRSRDFTGSQYGLEDRVGHGTHTAGTIGARDNGQGILPIAPDCRLLICKVLGDDGTGGGAEIAGGIRHAMSCNARILNMSLGSPTPDDLIRQALEEYVAWGGLVCCAAGNSGPRPNTGEYPAQWGNIALSVAALGQDQKIASFSSRSDEVDVAAPGVHVVSCWPQNRYAYLDGTSMATPHLAGVMALVRGYREKHGLPQFANQAAMWSAISATSRDLPLEPSTADGRGVVNPSGLLEHGVTKTPGSPATPGDPGVLSVHLWQGLGRDWSLVGVPSAAS